MIRPDRMPISLHNPRPWSIALAIVPGLLLVVGSLVPGQQADRAAPSPAPGAGAHLSDPKKVRDRLKLSPEYDGVPGVEALKVAVLDYGFEGIGQGRGYLPPGYEVVEHYDPEFVRRHGLGDPGYRKGFEPGNRHGRDMAQVLWATSGSLPRGPKFYLLNANGPTMLRRAVRYAVERQVDLILFSGSFEGGGNGDGLGPVDRIVDEAVGRGILWINASGNYGGKVFDAPVRLLRDGFLKLRNSGDIASIRLRNHVDENTVVVTLTWNDYRSEEDAGTLKDLDLIVEDWAGRVVGKSEKVQVAAGPGDPGPDETRNPRERVTLTGLPANPYVPKDPEYAYRIRVRAKRGQFGPRDRIRILVTASREVYVPTGTTNPEEAVTLVDATGREELYPPADHPGVITVGDSGPASSVGPTLDGRAKPDVILDDSRVDFSDGLVTGGSSNAAAYFAGVAIVLKAAQPSLKAADLLTLARQGPLLPRDRSRQNLHLWQTPTRAKLFEVVRQSP